MWKEEMIRESARGVQRDMERIHRQLSSQILSELNKDKLTPAQCRLLYILLDKNVCTVTEAARNLYVTPSAITAITNRLTRRKMIKRRRDCQDRRVVEISITDKGKDIILKIGQQAEDFYIPILKSLGEEGTKELIRLQKRMVQIIGGIEK
jgi:DNA-binding MarR family transcriptional regulator